jgi:hypothetical protein
MHNRLLALAVAVVTAVSMGCSQSPSAPAAPSPADPASAGALPDGATLKVTAPTLMSPVGGVLVEDLDPDLVIGNSQPMFVPSLPLAYVFRHIPVALHRPRGRGGTPRPRQFARPRPRHGHPPHRPHLQLHLGLRCALRDVQQLEVGQSQDGHDAGQLEPASWHPLLGRGREPEHLGRRADHAERSARDGRAVPPAAAAAAQDRHQHDRPHAAPRHPDAHADRRVLRAHDVLVSIRVSLDGIGDVHNQVRDVKRGFEKASETIEAMQALADRSPHFQFGIASTIFATNMTDAENILAWARVGISTSCSTCCGSPTPC